jgi:hypothetical protein
MATPRVPAGSRIFIQTALGAAQAISAISKANPGVVSYAGLDPANGDYLALTDMRGMIELQDGVVKAANVNGAGNTLELEDQDTSTFTTFTSGNFKPITFGAEFEAATGFSFTGGNPKFQSYTLLRDKQEMEIPVGYEKAGASIQSIWDPQDSGLAAVRAAARTSQKLAMKVLFPDGLEMLFFGYIGASGLPNASNSQSIMETTVSLSMATVPLYVFP